MAKPILVVDVTSDYNINERNRVADYFKKATDNEYHIVIRNAYNNEIQCINPDNTVNNVDVQKLIEALTTKP
jgi:hypothetical protein